MNRLVNILVGALSGAIAGACSVALLIAMTNYFSMGTNGSAFYVIFLSAVIGAYYGTAVGGFIGIVVGLFARNRKLGGLIGAIVGCTIAIYYFSLPSEVNHRILFGLAAILIGTLSGVAAIMGLDMSRRT